MQTVPNSTETRDKVATDAWWAGYAQALRDFPNGVSDVVQANRAAVVDLLTRIEAGPTAPTRPHLRVLAGGAA